MKFYNYIKNVNINLTKEVNDLDEGLDVKSFNEIQKIIGDLNEELRLSKNKKRFKLSLSKDIPVLKNHNEEKVVEEWLKANEKLTDIKKSFLFYLDTLTI